MLPGAVTDGVTLFDFKSDNLFSHRSQRRRLHGAWGARAPTFTNGWARGHREQNIKQEIAKYFLS